MTELCLPAVTIPASDTPTDRTGTIPAELLRDLIVPGDRRGALILLGHLRA